MKFIDVKKEVEAAASESRLNPDFTALHIWTNRFFAHTNNKKNKPVHKHCHDMLNVDTSCCYSPHGSSKHIEVTDGASSLGLDEGSHW